MEYPNENMEEFFKNSLDKFSDDPSDSVWHDLDKRLEQDKPKGFLMNWLKYILPAALLLFSLSAMYVYQLKLLSEYKTQLATIVNENKDLRLELVSQNNASSANLEQDKIVQTEYAQQTSIINQTKLKRDTVFIVKYREQQQNINWLSAVQIPTIDFSVYTTNRVLLDQFNHPVSDLVGAARFENQESSDRTPFLLTTVIQEGPLASLASEDPVFAKMKFAPKSKSNRKRKKKKLGLFEAQGPIIIDKSDPWGRPEFYYRAGLSFNVLNSLKGEQFSNSSIGFGYGLMQEIGLTSRFAVTSGIMQNIQEYALSNNGLPLDENDISKFPNQENLNTDIIRAEVQNRFVEIPVGVKYDFYQDNQKSLFISPGVKWSIHKPQEFNYYLAENRFSSFSTNQKFGYLNAIHFALGIEKIINPSITYQVSLGYDYNLEPIGIEQQRLNSMYLKCNLLFGKK